MELKELNETVATLVELRKKKKDAEEVVKDFIDRIAEFERKILDVLEANELPSYRAPAALVSAVTKRSFTTPKTKEEKQAFLEYLKSKAAEQGGVDVDSVYWNYISVNSNSLNSWCNKELALREQQGDFNVEIPGLGEPSERTVLSVRG